MNKKKIFVHSGIIHCPKCKAPHQYYRKTGGEYLIQCNKCKEVFTLTLSNPKVSFSSGIGSFGKE